MQWITKAALIRLGILLGGLMVLFMAIAFLMTTMPEKSYSGQLPPLTASQQQLRDDLNRDIKIMTEDIGEHNYLFYNNLIQVEKFLKTRLSQAGYSVNTQEYSVNGQVFSNLEVEIKGTEKPDEIVIIGAHYDSVVGSPGANDNGTGAVAVLSLAQLFSTTHPKRTLRFVEFVNEEPPFFWSENMGSLVYAKRCQKRQENIVAMLSLETMGFYSQARNSQQYPVNILRLIYPNQGNFIGFIGNIGSRSLIHQVIAKFRTSAQFPSQGVSLPDFIPGVGWSDHWSFWQVGYPALMVTDTAPFRYPYYHTQQDTPDQIDYDSLTYVVSGLQSVIQDLTH
ncbi:Peptidase, M28 family [Planktothrix serta PCC 8927]|uniref:Peptidase, M28 family n=1 Tax=Planktothrix serta PCC 8927 TaxID=671068 RepID=A0A7Z9DYD9_9CYAN|nr:M28 family peptidase [Planktothrix serta]VXD15643.1 Peptidase, M28 family [Planktothrix serta PCC 8927]